MSTTDLFAVSTTEDGLAVARFGHDFPLFAYAPSGVPERRMAEGCCGHLAQAVSDCAAVVCTAIGGGAANHLAQAGVQLIVVPVGTPVAAAVATYRAGRLQPGGKPTACDHGHDHAHAHAGGGCCGH